MPGIVPGGVAVEFHTATRTYLAKGCIARNHLLLLSAQGPGWAMIHVIPPAVV